MSDVAEMVEPLLATLAQPAVLGRPPEQLAVTQQGTSALAAKPVSQAPPSAAVEAHEAGDTAGADTQGEVGEEEEEEDGDVDEAKHMNEAHIGGGEIGRLGLLSGNRGASPGELMLPVLPRGGSCGGNVVWSPPQPKNSLAAQIGAPPAEPGAGGPDPRLSLGSHRFLLRARPPQQDVDSDHVDDYQPSSPHRYWSLLVVTPILASSLSFVVDQSTQLMSEFRARLVQAGDMRMCGNIAVNVMICVGARLVVRLAKEAQGSGLPEIKTMLFSGATHAKMQHYLTLKVLAVKAVALTAVVGAGLPIGKEGPFVHLTACITANLDPTFYKSGGGAVSHLLLASVAVGVGTTFSAPLGGVLFALELMLPQVYDLTAYWGCFTGSVVGAVMYSLWKTYTVGDTPLLPLMTTDVAPGEGLTADFPLLRLLLDVSLGVTCGLLGALFIKMHKFTAGNVSKFITHGFFQTKSVGLLGETPGATFKSFKGATTRVAWDGTLRTPMIGRSQVIWTSPSGTPSSRGLAQLFPKLCTWFSKFEWRDLFVVGTVAALNTLAMGQVPLLAGTSQPELLSLLFSKNMDASAGNWTLPGEDTKITTIHVSFLLKWVMTVGALSLPTPTGIVAPTMIIGALLGRAFCAGIPVSVQDMMLARYPGQEITDTMRGAFAARMAIVGAAAFCAAVSRAFSTAITVFEVLALPGSVLPLTSACLASVFVADECTPGFFDQILLSRGFAGVPAISGEKRMMPVSKVMRRVDFHTECLSHRASLSDMQRLTSNSNEALFPIVHHLRGGVDALLVGTISRAGIDQILCTCRSWERDAVVDFLDPGQFLQDHASGHAINRMPLHVAPNRTVKDVFLLLKVMYDEKVVYVTSKGRLLGIVTRDELLGKTV